MLKIGLTGGIASGKSTVANMFVKLGAYLVDADHMARKAVAPGSPALKLIAQEFGDDVLDKNGNLDRAVMRDKVFSDEKARRRVNEIVHPQVAELIFGEIMRIEQEHPDAIVIVDVPLLFESGWQNLFAATVLVYVDPEVQVKRLVARDKVTRIQAAQALASQMPIMQKRELATFLIDNSGGIEQTRGEVGTVWDQIKSLGAG